MTDSGTSWSLKLAIGFAGLALVAALVAPQFVQVGPSELAVAERTELGSDVDRIMTGSIKKVERTKLYTVRRSIWQKNPEEDCIIYQNGQTEGGC